MQSLRQYWQFRSQPDSPQAPQKIAESENGNASESSSPPSAFLAPGGGGLSTASQDTYALVDWSDAKDPLHPRNWSLRYKVFVCVLVFINILALDWCSSDESQASTKIAKEFNVSAEKETIASAMFVFGIAFGSLLAGPISETVGRNPIYVGSRLLHLGFILGTALAPNFATQVACRFFAGLGASTILCIHGASIADLFGPEGRNYAWPLVGSGSFFGTALPPVVGGWIAQSSHISWRWTDWIAVILSGFTFIITVLLLPETFSPILLKWKAHHIRKTTGNPHFLADIELQKTFRARLGANLLRAVNFATREYICILFMAWLVVLYIVIFGFLQGFNFLFYDTFSFSRGLTGTSFVTLAIGIALYLACLPIISTNHQRLARAWRKSHSENEELPPEYRMFPAFISAFTFPISMFWLGWTNYASLSPFSCLGACVLFGFSWAGIYLPIYQYILDVYGIYAGTALATMTFARYSFSGGMQLVSRPMWMNLDTHWTCTLLGCLATALAPVPFLIFRYGKAIRGRSQYARKKMKEDGAEDASQEEKV